jgi:hypothetical protein
MPPTNIGYLKAALYTLWLTGKFNTGFGFPYCHIFIILSYDVDIIAFCIGMKNTSFTA